MVFCCACPSTRYNTQGGKRMKEDMSYLMAEIGKGYLAEQMEQFLQQILSRSVVKKSNPVYERKLLLQLIIEVAIELQDKGAGI